MIIVIPMAGASSRFVKEGYAPKYTLKTQNGNTLFDDSVSTFKKWFDSATFLFIIKDQDAYNFVDTHVNNLGIKNYYISNLDFLTKGQAQSVYLGLKNSDLYNIKDSLVIFNIDTIIHNLNIPDFKDGDAFFDAFYDENADPNKWSFCKVDKNNNIIKTAEKEKISSWCSTGLYIFKDVSLFINSYDIAVKNENYNFYISPLYNYLPDYCISKLMINDINNIDFAGTPKDYNDYLKKFNN